MKTIEERAEQYANPDYAMPSYVAYAQRNAYIAGAKDQQYIDKLLIEQLIDKACEWLEGYCCEIGCKYDCNYDDIMVNGPKRFRKAMEEAMGK